MIENYINYLNYITGKLNEFFENQKPYIKCQKGCSLCCKNADFPFSRIEVDLLLIGSWRLSDEIKQRIDENINKLIQEKLAFKGDIFKHDCPFLIKNECAVYEYRGIICRSFGLINVGADGHMKIPFCCYKGLNYSTVIDENESKISEAKYKALGFKEEPMAFNTSYEFLTDKAFEEDFKFSFGEKKPLIDWFMPQE